MKFWHIDVMQRVKSEKSGNMISKQIPGPNGSKKFLTVGEANTHFAAMKEQYPAPQYQVYKENRE
jgi:hypothetical protein